MKATITLKTGTVITGVLCKVDGSTIYFDAFLNAQQIIELSEAGCTASKLPCGGDWYVIADFKKIQSYIIED